MIYGMGEVLANADTLGGQSSSQLPDFLRSPARLATTHVNHKDFLMLTEFTDDVGPVPLRDYIIPNRQDIENDRCFSLDDFSIKMMSADYFAQATVQDGSFRMPDNMHAVISNAQTNCYTLLYAFTLYDVHGRGYVRPLYLAYTSCVREKIVSMHNRLSQAITKAVHRLVHCNIRKFADELQHGDACLEEQTSSDDVPFITKVQDTVKRKLSSMNSCCPLISSMRSRATSVSSDWDHVNNKGETELRQVTALSDYWPEFYEDLLSIYKIFSQSSSQIRQHWREEQLAYDTFNSLNIGGNTYGSLKCNADSNSRFEEPIDLPRRHGGSLTSVDSIYSESSFPSNPVSSLCSSSQDGMFSEPTSITSADFYSDPGIDSLPSDEGATKLTSDQDQQLLDSQRTLTEFPDYYSASTDSLLSRNESIGGQGYDLAATGTQLLDTGLTHLSSRTTLKYTELRSLITDDREHARDLIYSVMVSRPVVLVECRGPKSKEYTHERIARALTSFIPVQYRVNTHSGYHIVNDELTLKSICTEPITCVVTSSKSFKISDNIKAYASIYEINSRTYTGLQYTKDTSKKASTGMLDLFYRKRKHKFPYYSLQVESMLLKLACKAQLLHSLLQRGFKTSDNELMKDLELRNISDLNIIKNLVHVVLKQQYVSSQGLKEEDITAMSLLLTPT